MLAILFALFIACQLLTPTVAAITERSKDKSRCDDAIMFVEPIEVVKTNDHDKDVPLSCKGQTYCTIKTEDYPEKKFNEMLKGRKVFRQPQLLLNPLQNKQGDPNDKNDCESEISYEPLYKVREGIDKPWRYVVQSSEHDYIQKVRLERCLNPNGSCFTQFSSFLGYGTYCKQENSYWEVLVSKGENETEVIKAELPVCCSCYYSKNR
ncbi:uncharacterized protein LOC116766801 [Danaus plexippus]|uniref:uncharacterized protein LOC116766801 n=1 Tax=Danaus plexippus TaxID=13037 RepID=UPI002AB2EB95|nr:uncharacterized protein LOC116766801 [Danaus plexippus]